MAPVTGEDHALSDSEIKKLVPGVKIISYPDLQKFPTLESVLDPQGRVVILFLTENKSSGHWVCLFRNGKKTFEWFDSYGLRPDGNMRWLSKSKLIALNEEIPVLTDLIVAAEKGGARVDHNPYKLQGDHTGIETCGRHVACRLLQKHLPLDDYVKWVTKGGRQDPDSVVTEYTNSIIKR